MDLVFLVACELTALALMVSVFRIHQVPSVTGTVFLTLFIMHGLTAVPYAMGIVGADIIPEVSPAPEFPVVIGSSFALYALGTLAFSRLWGFNLRQAHLKYMNSPTDVGRLNKAVYVVVLIAVLVIGILYAYGAGRTGVAVLSEQARDEAALKDFRDSFRESNAYSYPGALVNNVFGPLVFLIALGRARVLRSRVWAAVAGAVFVVLVLTSTAALHKEPLGTLLLFVMLGHYYLRREGAPSGSATARLWLYMFLGLAAVGFGGYLLTYNLGANDAWEATLRRVTVIPQVCVNGFLYVYPRILPFDDGLGIGLVARLAGVSHYVSPAVAVGTIITNSPDEVSANAFWSSELWSSFGYPGVLIGSFLIGGLMIGLDRWCLQRKRDATSTALCAFLVVAAVKIPSGSIFTGLLSGGLGLGPLVFPLFQTSRFADERRSSPMHGARTESSANSSSA